MSSVLRTYERRTSALSARIITAATGFTGTSVPHREFQSRLQSLLDRPIQTPYHPLPFFLTVIKIPNYTIHIV